MPPSPTERATMWLNFRIALQTSSVRTLAVLTPSPSGEGYNVVDLTVLYKRFIFTITVFGVIMVVLKLAFVRG
jgi:hypothetical protein